MKLRNKKTCEVVDLIGTERSCPSIGIGIDYHDGNPKMFYYNSLAELNEEWEDYKPAEPLIKDEKVRKAVKAWAEINDLYSVGYKEDSDGAGFDCIKSTDELVRINFASLILPLEKNRVYTITELCGEEEE